MPDVLDLSITVLRIDRDIWCDACTAPSVVTVCYVTEQSDRAPLALYSVTYCETCEDR